MKLLHSGRMIVRPETTLEETDMDGAQNQVQEIPGQLVDTGPTEQDVLQARMVLAERELRDRLQELRRQLAMEAPDSSCARLAQVTGHLVNVEQRLVQLRQLRGDW